MKLAMKNERSYATSARAKRRLRRVICSLFLVAAVVAAVGAVASPRANQGRWSFVKAVAMANQKIAPWVIQHTANGQEAEFFVVLAEQADMSQAGTLRTKAEKGRYVYNRLLNEAQTTQQPILQWLRESGVKHRSFYIVNAILVKGTSKSPRHWQPNRTWRASRAIR